MFYSPASGQERALRGEHRHPQVHRCSTQPSEKNLRRGFLFFKTQDKPHRRASRAGKAHPCRLISKPERYSKTAVRRSLPSGYSATGRHGSVRRPQNPRTRPAPSRGRWHWQAALRAGRHATAVHHPVCIYGAWPGSHPQGGPRAQQTRGARALHNPMRPSGRGHVPCSHGRRCP